MCIRMNDCAVSFNRVMSVGHVTSLLKINLASLPYSCALTVSVYPPSSKDNAVSYHYRNDVMI